MDILNVLEKATQINSVSGSENEIRKFISDNVKKYCDELLVDGISEKRAPLSGRSLPQTRKQPSRKRQRQKDYVRGTYGRDWYNCNRY